MFAIYLSGLFLIAAVSWAVAAPFFRSALLAGTCETDPESRGDWEARRDEALAGINDVELDFRIGKLSAADYHDVHDRLAAQAIEAIRHIEENTGESDDR